MFEWPGSLKKWASSQKMSVFNNDVVFIYELNPLPYFLNSLAKPYLEALDDIIDKEEEGELEENDDDEEEGLPDQEEQEEGQEEQDNDDEGLYRQFIEDVFSDNDVE